MPELDAFAAASAAALADLQVAPATETPAPAVVETPPAEPITPPVAPETDLTFEVKVQGQTHKLSKDEMVELAQKGLDYTKKTQSLSERERQVGSTADILKQRETELTAFLQDKGKMRTWLQKLEAANPEAHPDDIPTQSQLQAALLRERATLQEQLKTEVAAAETRIAQREMAAEVAERRTAYDVELTKTVSGLVEKFPHLDTYETADLDRMLRADIAAKVSAEITAFPDREISMDKVKTLLVEAAKVRNEKVEAKIQNHLKMEKVRAAKVERASPEPAGGSATTPAATPAKPLKLGTPDFLQSVIDDVNALGRR